MHFKMCNDAAFGLYDKYGILPGYVCHMSVHDFLNIVSRMDKKTHDRTSTDIRHLSGKLRVKKCVS